MSLVADVSLATAGLSSSKPILQLFVSPYREIKRNLLRMSEFLLHPQLKADTSFVCDLPLCRVLLTNDSNYLWLILVPRMNGLTEIVDLGRSEQHMIMDEIAIASDVLKMQCNPDKLNVAALGNQVQQLHVHVIARFKNDEAWPGPVWGKVDAREYSEDQKNQMLNSLIVHFGKAKQL